MSLITGAANYIFVMEATLRNDHFGGKTKMR